ncbi:MAG: hypothetical protein GY830_04660 [Bacteroidetes bacterium]|nr:hypothetical protein [Bacteroidota bacterium]
MFKKIYIYILVIFSTSCNLQNKKQIKISKLIKKSYFKKQLSKDLDNLDKIDIENKYQYKLNIYLDFYKKLNEIEDSLDQELDQFEFIKLLIENKEYKLLLELFF